MNSKTLQFSLLAAILASTAAVGAAIISENDEVLRKAKIQIIDRKFQDAANALAADPGTGEQAQERRYLRGHALLLANDAAGATQVFESYLKDFPNGLDATRARHGIAAANRIQKNFDGAANILRDELKKLLSPARRMDLAKVYIEYAERAEKGAAPNFTRARSFYDLALTLELPPVDDERIRTKAAEMSEKLNDNPDALQRLLYVQKTHGAGKDGITKFRVAELQRKSGDAFGARRAYRDFLKDYSSSEKAVEAAYGIGLTFGMPQPPSDEMLALGVAAFQELILKFPAHDLSRKAAFEIALAEFQRGRFDDAIRDFQAFVSSGKKDEKDDRIAVARATVGDAYYRQSKFTEAIAAWKLYLSEHPTHGGFARVHKSIVDAEHSIAMKAASDALENSTKARELGDAARAAIQTFLAAHPLDARHASTAMQLAKIEETRERYDVAREEFERIVSKYAGSNESSEGQYHVGRIYEEKTFDYEKAIDSYKKVKGAYQPAAAARLAALQSKSLALRTKRTFRSDEDPSVEISSRNIEKLRFRAYKLDLEVFFRAKLATPAIEPLDVEVIAADVRRDAVTENYIAHKETTRAVGLPEFKGKPGAYVVKVDDGEFEATSLVIISDLVIITKGMKNGVLVFAQNARTGDPVRDARLVISDGKSILLEEKTGADGVLSRPSAWKDPVSNLVVYGSSEGGAAVSGMDLRSLATVESLKERSIIISDRSSYRPGDTVKMWAVSRSVHNNSYAIEEGRDVKLILADPSGVTIRSADAKLSAFGTAASNFEIPASGAFGTWTLQVRDVTNKNVLGSRGVEVEETRRDRIRVELNLEKAVVMRGDAVKGTVKVRYFSGGPAAKRSITITLQENDPISLTTDEAGNVNFTLETRELAEEGLYPIVARVEEEGVFGVSELAVATVEFRPLLKIAQPVVLANEAFDVSIETKDAGRKPIAADLQLSVFKIEERGNRKTQTLAGKTNEKTGEGNVRITIPDGGRYFVRAEGKDRFGTPVFADAAIEVSGDDDAQKLRIFTERENWKLGESFKARVVSRLLNTKKTLMTFEGNGILEYKIIDVPKGETTLEFPMMENLAPQCTFALAAVDEWKLYYAQKTIRVSKQLNIEIAAPKDPLAPGSAAEASVIVQDAQGRPVASEVALAIVDSAFLAKRGDNNSRLHDFFFASSRAAGTRTASSCGFEYSAPTKRVAKDLAAEEDRQMQEKLRSDERAKSLDRANGFVANDPTGNYKGPSDTLAAAPSTPASGDSAEPMSNSILEDESRGELKDQIDSLGYVGGGGNSGGGGAYRGPTGGSRNMTVRGGKSRSAVTKTGQVAGRPSAKPGASKDKKAEAGEILESMQQLDLDVEGLSWRGLAVELEDGSVRQPVARSNFNETAEFAIVTTDAEGRGKLKFTLPDSTTEWTVTGRGVTRATELGEGNATFTTFREIEASLRLPAAVTEGDKMDSVVTVRNAGTQKRSVETNITVEGGDGSGTTTLELAGGEESTASRPIKVADATNLKVKVDAKAGDVSDSIERSVGIRPAGSFVTVAESAVVRDQALLELNISNFNQLRRRAFEIVVTPSLQSDVLEDAGSDVKPRLSGPFIDTTGWAVTRGETALERMGFLGRFSAGNEAAIAKQRARVQDAIAKIAAERLSDGSLNWAGQLNTSLDKHFTPERTSDAATSARALAFLGRARTAGFTVADEVFDKLVSWLADRLRKEENAADRARIVYALAEAKAADFELVNRLQRAKAELTDVALAHLALADIRLNRRDLAAEIVELLQKRAKTGKAEMPWGGADDGAEATGLIVSVLSQLDPLQPTLASAVDRLRSARRGWLGDRGEAAAVRGLAAFSLHSKMDTSEFTLTIEVNGENVKELKSSDVAGPVAFSIDAAKIRDKNEIRAKLAGRGEVSLYVAASGYTKEFKPNASAFAGMTRRVEPAYLIYRGKTIPRGYSIVDGPYTTITNEVNNLPVGAEANVETSFSLREKEQNFADYIYLEDPIPAGCEIVPNSIQGSFERVVVRDGSVIAAFPPKSRSGWVRFRILGVRTGEYMYGPTLVKSAYRPDRAGEGKSKKITIQPLGSKTTDEIKLTPDEMYHLGVAKFDAGERADGAKWLRLVCQESRLREEPLREATRRILQDAIERMDSTETIAAFERLRDRFTDVTLPFETVVKVGEAYITAKQAEMGDLLFRGTTAALYRSESNVAGALLREGEFMAAVTFMDQLNRIYPDFTEILNAIHQLAGLVAATANGAQTSAAKATKPPREMLLTKSSELELEFLYRSPASALAPEAAFGYLAAQLDLEHYKEVVQGCGAFAARYPDSEWLDESLYLEGYARFASGDSKNALLVLNRVVDEKFPDGSSSRGQSGYRDRAVLLRAQILHAGGDAKTAVAEYEKVKNNFTDAADAVQAFRSKQLTLAPVVTLDMQEKAELTITSKNLAKASARVYRVDLMRLYLMERNLDRMTGIDLSGIAPLIIKDLALGSTEDFTGRETKVQFELQEKGAYLVVIRSDAEAGAAPLAATTLILRTDLKLEVREDAAAGRVWVNVRDSNNASVAKADVRIVGTRDGSVRVGATDLRGVFVAEGVHGRSTVVAQVNPKDANDKEGPSFAFYKGSTELAAPAQTASEGKKDYGEFEKAATDQLRRQNFELQSRNALQIETQLLNTNIGVELKNVK